MPKWLKRLLHEYDEYRYFCQLGDAFGCDAEDPLPSGQWLCEYLWAKVLARFCKHPNMTCEGYASPETGSEDFFCPDCGWSHHVRYY